MLVIVLASIGSIAVTQGNFIGTPEIGGGEKSIESKTFNQNQDRTYSLSNRAVQDHAGNIGNATEEIVTIKIDKEPPVYSGLSCQSWGYIYDHRQDLDEPIGWINQSLECHYNLSDPNPTYNSQLRQWQSAIGSTAGTGNIETWLVDKNDQDIDEIIESNTFIQEQKRAYQLNGITQDYAQNETLFRDPENSSETEIGEALHIKIDKTPPSITEIQCAVCSEALVDGKCPEEAEKTPYLGTNDDLNFSLGWSNKDVYCYYTVEDQDPEGEYNYNSKLEYWGHDFKTQGGTGAEGGWEMP